MHEMQTTVTNDRGVCPSVCLSRRSTLLHGAKTFKRIKILFGANALARPRNIALDGGPRGRKSWGEIFAHRGPTTFLKIGSSKLYS